ncbi:glycosyltransferase family 2 protein [Tengunoibacter tsumagoiensis]|uniref:Glycosyltransferase 2-like domain-containing protein n=1 Tax=Tengunoibacter tsumagoiensis TaxID=2014871 RepID=A0A402A0E6_9CHLR|nr:glycosyltransferase [Tengunoibacter tsumagoiensis]GCE12584.1 hypothetical protein KTT_24430 [Tengunoibacter tsumagoiensis]
MSTHPYRHSSIPEEILALSHERDILRRRGQYDRADLLKRQLEEAGYLVKDNPHGAHLVILPSINVDGKLYRTTRQLPSMLEEPDLNTFSVIIVVQNNAMAARRCCESILKYAGGANLEVLLVDNASQDGFDLWAETQRHRDSRVHLLRTSRTMPLGEARNVGLKQSHGRYIVLLDAAVELTGDIFTPLAEALADETIGLTGACGLHTDDLRHFEESTESEVEVIDGTCMAFKRSLLHETGLFDEHYRFPLYMDIDFSFSIRDEELQTIRLDNLPLVRHLEEQSSALSDSERTRITKRNFYHFLEKWGDRDDLLLYSESEEDEEYVDEDEDSDE